MLWPMHKLTRWSGKDEIVPEGWSCQSGMQKGKMLPEKILRWYDAWGQHHSLPHERFWCVVVWILTYCHRRLHNFLSWSYQSFHDCPVYWIGCLGLENLGDGFWAIREGPGPVVSPHMVLVVDSDLRLSLGSGIMWLANIVNVWNISESKSWIVQRRQ